MRQQGDTVIEVILSVTVFSLVAVSALALMNSGIRISQRSLETTLVRQQIDAQAELLRYVSHATDAEGVWDGIKRGYSVNTPVAILDVDTCPAATSLSRAFVLWPSGVSPSDAWVRGASSISDTPDTYAKVAAGGSQGVSIQLVEVGGDDRVYDAYIQACWNGPGASRPVTIGTIVRIYDANS